MNSSGKLALALALLGAGAAQAKVMEDTVAVVNGSPVLLSEFQKEFTEAAEFWARRMPEALNDPEHVKRLKDKILEELIARELLYQEGVKLKIKVRERDVENGIAEIRSRFKRDEAGKEVSEAEAESQLQKQLKNMGMTEAQFRERLSKQIMARKVIEEVVRPRVKLPEEKETRAYFERLKAFVVSGSSEPPKDLSEEEQAAFFEVSQHIKAMSSERVRVSRILVKFSPNATPAEKKRALKTAQDIKKRLDGAASFAEVAKEESEDPDSAPRGGDLGYVLRGVAPPAFEKAAFALPVGDISEPIETEMGYNIIRVQEKRAAEAPEFERFKDDLTRFLGNMGFDKEVQIYVKSLKDKAVVERNLPS